MKTLRRLLCWLGLHSEPPGIDARWCIRWACATCGAVLDGELARGRKR